MKTLVLILSVIFLSTSSVFAQTKTASFKVAGECGTCKKKIEKAAKTAGASYALWNVDTKMLTVKYANTATDKTKIEEAIAGAGYDTPNMKATDEAYKSLDECCQYQRTSATAQSCCDSEKCTEAACFKEGKCAPDKSCCKEAGCDKKDCCKKA